MQALRTSPAASGPSHGNRFESLIACDYNEGRPSVHIRLSIPPPHVLLLGLQCSTCLQQRPSAITQQPHSRSLSPASADPKTQNLELPK